ncbi:MAG TPA: hypothetical protein VF662_07965 [Allosphingosinicella sp.]|jgi:hypothetical protein
MSTYQKGWRFFWAAASLMIPLWVWFFLVPPDRSLIFVLMAAPTVVVLTGYFACRCRICGKSAFRREIYSERSLVGTMINPVAFSPEEFCSRCGADLWEQQAHRDEHHSCSDN